MRPGPQLRRRRRHRRQAPSPACPLPACRPVMRRLHTPPIASAPVPPPRDAAAPTAPAYKGRSGQNPGPVHGKTCLVGPARRPSPHARHIRPPRVGAAAMSRRLGCPAGARSPLRPITRARGVGRRAAGPLDATNPQRPHGLLVNSTASAARCLPPRQDAQPH
ncbi:uncharacterized protein SCHCODRAFT_02067094 [Schizophyllum commune H4-8]|uniref:uncharacterized protein n=1 Tax=Schizophyllum commune (strain H4-8 / FGSC 9210) TaxID=578458 RepID=UPI002160045F|nr:uncharacterized protein SCHCODRAFT_02067094 [Schizophyllum commune H4-8]KAI5887513.1 hypothetical protein SCHCODRAFT_02067094 [Schizophyllum commune H4-8]